MDFVKALSTNTRQQKRIEAAKSDQEHENAEKWGNTQRDNAQRWGDKQRDNAQRWGDKQRSNARKR